ncbi:hypothetical protein M422DRAFT_25498 [Sphaerobolus stellatus SS14]|nr:hypothetical protein M422DRAFT_25498 [Sphaerobolus stellatus SS14]
MFTFRSAATILACAALAQATITITNFNITGNGTSTISWASSDLNTDPESFSIEITNPSFNTQFAVGNNVQTTAGQVMFETPGVQPGPNYGIQFVAINNATQILAMSQPFSIVEHDVTSSTVSSFSGTGTIATIPISSSSNSASTTGTTPGTTSAPSTSSSSSSSSSTSSASVFNSGGSGGSNSAAFALNAPVAVGFGAVVAGLVALLA